MSLHVTFSGAQLRWRLPLCRIELEQALAAMVAVSPDPAESLELDLLLVRDADMARLNREHMDCPGPTNILSFPLEELTSTSDRPMPESAQENTPVPLGSLVLSVDALHREARLYGQDLQEHCLRLLAHGLGHLAGYDHSPEMDALCAAMLDAGRTACTGCAPKERKRLGATCHFSEAVVDTIQ